VGLFQLAEWLRVRATADDELAAAEIGIVPYYSGLRVLDIFGLADRHIARLPGLPGAKSDPDYIFGRKPRFILMRIDDSCLCGALPADVPLFNDSRMIADYELARSIKAGSSRIVLFERRATPLFDLHYDFGNAWNPSRLRVVSAAGETLPEAPPGEPAPLVPAFLASPDVRDRRRAEARASLGDDSSPEVRATAMREWLSAFRPFLAEPSTPGIAAPGRPRLELRYDVEIPANARLRFAIGAPEDTWTPESGDGMGFEIRVRSSDSRETLVFDETIDPRHDPAQRRWLEREVDLSPWNGQRITIVFSTTAGPAGDMRGDFPGWGRPLLVSALDDIAREP